MLLIFIRVPNKKLTEAQSISGNSSGPEVAPGVRNLSGCLGIQSTFLLRREDVQAQTSVQKEMGLGRTRVQHRRLRNLRSGCSWGRFGVSTASRLRAGQERDGSLQEGALIRSSLDLVQTFLQAAGGVLNHGCVFSSETHVSKQLWNQTGAGRERARRPAPSR